MYKVFFSAFLSLLISPSLQAMETVSFPSEDGLVITADYYPAGKAPLIVLFHQAGWSRGEYREIAPKLNALGYACLAVDLRSGGKVNGVVNRTHERAVKMGLPTTYTDALADMRAALQYATGHLRHSRVIIWGSSYSSALVFVVAANHPKKVRALLSFSPGEYFTRLGKSARYIRDHAARVTAPVFITSAKKEKKNWLPIFNALPVNEKVQFIPQTDGQHGSRALWEKFPEHNAYWQAVQRFLNSLK